MKLSFKKQFSLELDDITLKGDFKELTKKQSRSLDKRNKATNSIISQNQRLLRDLENAKATLDMSKNNNDMLIFEETKQIIDNIEIEIDDIDFEKIADNTDKLYFDRLELSVSGDDKEAILDLAKEYGAKIIFDTIVEDIQERAKKK